MLRVTIELVPFGEESKKKKIGEMLIANTGQGRGTNHSYEGWTGYDDHSKEDAMYGKLDSFDRSQSPWELVRLMLEAIRLEKHTPSKDKDSLAQRLKRKLDK